MAVSHAWCWLLNIVLFCVLSCAFGSDKYCNTCIKSGKWLFVVKTVQPWISSCAISRNLMPTRSRAGYTKSRVPFYSNCSATFNIEYLLMCGDISPIPGPKSTRTYTECDRVVPKNHRAIKCDLLLYVDSHQMWRRATKTVSANEIIW
jgi:hypothetical protein